MCLQWEFENLYRSIEDPPHLQSDFGECQKSTIHLTSPLKFTSSPTYTPYNPSSIYTRQTLKVIAAEYRDNISNNRRIHFFFSFFRLFFCGACDINNTISYDILQFTQRVHGRNKFYTQHPFIYKQSSC